MAKVKVNTSKSPDPNSLRSQRRAKRSFSGSRPLRRALKRLSIAMGNYLHHGGKMPNEKRTMMIKPGAMAFH